MIVQREISRYLLVGGVNFIFTFLIFVLTLKLLRLDHFLSLLLAWISGNTLTYVLNFLWVFRTETRLSFGVRFLKYLTTGSFSVSFNLAAMFALVNLAGYDAFWAQAIIMPLIVTFNFFAAKFWSLRKSEQS